MSNTKDDFLPDNYEVPSSGGYLQLESGETRLRILSAPLMLWTIWEDGKVKRIRYDKENKPATPTKTDKDNVKHAWAMIVYDYKSKSIKVYECDKVSILSTLEKYARDADWGHPKQYDIKIEKSGSGMKTEYSLAVCPKSEPSNELVEAYVANPINLELMLEGKEPFLNSAGSKANTQTQTTQKKVVTPENWVAGDEVSASYKVVDGKLVKNKLPF